MKKKKNHVRVMKKAKFNTTTLIIVFFFFMAHTPCGYLAGDDAS